MSTNSSPPPAERPRIRPPFRVILLLIAGVVLVFAGGYIAERAELRESAYLDIAGRTAVGSVEMRDDGGYRVRYKHPGGSIYSRSEESLWPQRVRGSHGAITIRYAADEPQRFQPNGRSYIPGAAALSLFIAGMLLVITANRRLVRHYRSPATAPPDDAPKRIKKRPSI